MRDELSRFNHLLPKRIVTVFYESDILTIRSDAFLISIRCPFEVECASAYHRFPGADRALLKPLQGMDLLNARIFENEIYPDLMLVFSAATVAVEPNSGDSEMWYIDAPGVAFLTP